MSILPRGDPKSPIWVIIDKPYDKDAEKGYLYSCGYGYVFDKAFRDAGITENPFFFSPVCTGLASKDAWDATIAMLELYKPPFILSIGETCTAFFCPETKKRKKVVKIGEDDESSLEKWAGSLLVSPNLSYPHYVIPQVQPDRIVQHWEYRFIFVNIDLGHVREEFEWYRTNKKLQSLPIYKFTLQPSFGELREFLYDCYSEQYISVDIETIRPPKDKKTNTGKRASYPYCISIAPSIEKAISFSFWDYSLEEQIKAWRLLDALLSKLPQIGQNYFTFDSHYTEALGFTHCLEQCQDTMLRHQILWPELPHKLQFLTKQYTRQPYYKDEGKSWSPKKKGQLFKYNCLDTVVTYQCFLGQEEEFNDRPYLR